MNPIDTCYADQICYTTDISRFHSVCFGISNAIELFKKSYLYNLYASVLEEVEIEKQATIASVPLQDFPFSRYKMLLMREALFDNFLVGTSFELLGKAFLLDAGYLVHKIKDARSNSPIGQLHLQQKASPVKISDYLQHDQFKEYDNEGRSSLQYLQLKTVEYHTVYEQPGYSSVLPFSADFIALAVRYRKLRNMIHFPLAGASEAQIELGSHSLVEAYDVLNTEWRTIIKNKFEMLKQQHGIVLYTPTF